jgi:Kef-type K+ transport system membrane component KefB
MIAPDQTSALSGYDPVVLLWLVIFIFLSRSLSIVKKFGLPLVVGEILSGVILGELHVFGINLFVNAENDPVIRFLAEFGAIILMFEIGLDSKFSDLKHNFRSGIKMAISGTILTFSSGFLIAKFLIPNPTLSLELLLGVITAATATGISAKTFKEMGIIKSKEVQVVLVASILDELVSIFCFGIISNMILESAFNLTTFSISTIQAIGFFVFAAIFGNWITPILTKWSIKIHAGINMKIGVLLTVCFLFSWVAHKLGLATVVGAFVGGLILDQIYFKSFSQSNFFHQLNFLKSQVADSQLKYQFTQLIEKQEKRNLEELLKPISHVFVPIFFIYIGFLIDIHKLFDPLTLLITLALLLASFLGRIISGYLIRGKKMNKLVLGLGMTPIGEAGLIFAVFGKVSGVINDTVLSAIVAAVVIAAILTPILINFAIKRYNINHD